MLSQGAGNGEVLPAGAAGPGAPLTIGTAGHVDHGKTALVAALTGVDTDRLAEEKRRGLSIELGYAQLELPSGRRLSIVDVPGHERFIRTMVAGATGVDCWLMVIAATDGVKPQTREHAQILHALAIETGIIVITKTDLADGAEAVAQAQELMPGIPVVVCPAPLSARRPVVIEALDRFVAQIESRAQRGGPAIMHIDRCFTIDGAGTVVTGTLSSGQIRRGERLSVFPRCLAARVRSVQVHGVDVELARAGQRVAVNLARVPRTAIVRGDVLAAQGALRPAFVFDVELDFARPSGSKLVHAHHGTRVTAARLRDTGSPPAAQICCHTALMARPGDRIVLRDAAGRDTLGGAIVTAVRGGRGRAARAPARGRDAPGSGVACAVGGGATGGVGDGVAGGAVAVELPHAAIELAARLSGHGHHPCADAQLSADDRALLPVLCERGLIVRLAHGRHATVKALATVRAEIVALIAAGGYVTLPELRDRLGGSRSQAKAFLDYFDTIGFTRRRADDTRILRGRVGARDQRTGR